MTSIQTKRSLLRFYFPIVFVTVACCGMGALSFDMYLDGRDYLGLVITVVIFLLPVPLIISYFKNSPTVSVDEKQICFNNEIYEWSDISKVDLTGKIPFKYLFFNLPKEGTTLTFYNGSVKYFYDDFYANSWQVKSFIQQVIINKNESIETTTTQVDKNELRLENFETFKGNQFFSLYGIMFWAMLGMFAFIALTGKRTPPPAFYIFAVTLGTFWFFVASYLMYFFILSDKYFAVRNHNFFWVYQVYPIDDIKEIVFEKQGRGISCLRVITKDFRNKIYRADTLRNKTWLDLQDKLELKGISVRNESI